MWKEHVNRFEMRAGHGENVRRAVYQIGAERLAAQMADVYAVRFANLDCVETGRLSAHGVHSGRSHFDVFAIADQPAKQSFGNRTAADIARANKKDAFHDWRRARERENKVVLNTDEVNRSGLATRVCSLLPRSIFR